MLAGAKQGNFLAQFCKLLAKLEHGLVLLDHMALQVRVTLFQPCESFHRVHGATMRIAGSQTNPSLPAT